MTSPVRLSQLRSSDGRVVFGFGSSALMLESVVKSAGRFHRQITIFIPAGQPNPFRAANRGATRIFFEPERQAYFLNVRM
jgi:hypothetical protein